IITPLLPRPPTSTLFPTRRSSDLQNHAPQFLPVSAMPFRQYTDTSYAGLAEYHPHNLYDCLLLISYRINRSDGSPHLLSAPLFFLKTATKEMFCGYLIS